MSHEYVQVMDTRLTVEALYPDTILPSCATAGSAGYDAHAYLKGRKVTFYNAYNVKGTLHPDPDLAIMPGDRVLVPLGFKGQLPPGYEAQVRPRSGQVLKVGLVVANAPGTIDSDYAEEWGVILENTSQVPVMVAHEERIAQIVFARYEHLPLYAGHVGRTTSRDGGFGSTGT